MIMSDKLLNQALNNVGPKQDGDPDPGDCCTVPPGGGGDPGPGGPTG
jgi:hypothetical protein